MAAVRGVTVLPVEGGGSLQVAAGNLMLYMSIGVSSALQTAKQSTLGRQPETCIQGGESIVETTTKEKKNPSNSNIRRKTSWSGARF